MASADKSNGYEAITQEFISIRNSSSIGVATVCNWADTLPPGSTILDLGCGHGIPLSKKLIDKGFTLYGIDASPSMIAAFRSQFPNIQTECNTIEDSRFFGRRFDGVMAWGLMFLLAPDVQAMLIQKVASSLEPEGRFLFTAPQQACEWTDNLTGQKSVSLGVDVYRKMIESAGMVLLDETDDEGQNHYYLVYKPGRAG
ncbi:class I SAM-dependent methyltransferase [Chromatiaceae bacterium AAb-1]|nr:class I SAM-dependent methyltransferase [Chromatiaceae bacterium AAb-1]